MLTFKSKLKISLVFAVGLAGVFFALPVAHAATVGGANTATLTSGLVGYWTLDGNKTNWLTGKTQDLSGQGNVGQLLSLSTTTSLVTGKIGQALKFSNSTNYINVGSGASLTNVFAATGTVSAWIYPTGYGGNSIGRIMDKSDGTGLGAGWQFDVDNSDCTSCIKFAARLSPGGAGQWLTPNNSLVLNKWQHVMVVYNISNENNDPAVYINGVRQTLTEFQAPGGTPVDDSGTTLAIGNVAAGLSRGFDGRIDEARVYNRELSTIEIKQLYSLGLTNIANSNLAMQGSLVGYWPLDGSKTSWVSGVTQDLSGQGNPGQLLGMSTSTSPVVGKIGGALSFTNYSKSLQYVDAGASTALRFTSGVFSASAWVYSTSTGQQMFFMHGLGCSTFANWYLSIGGNESGGSANKYTFGFSIANAGATNLVASVPNATKGKWMHLVGTYDGVSKLSLYINGVLNNTATVSGVPYASTERLYMGQDPGCGGRFRVAGMLDDMRVFSRTLSAQEVGQLYGTGVVNVAHSNPSVVGSGLVGNWTFDGPKLNWATGQVLDNSGQGNTGQMGNMSTSSNPAVGKLGQAINFNGASQVITLGTPSALNIQSDITISAWVKPRSYGGGSKGRIIDKLNQGVNGYEFNIENINATEALQFVSGSNGTGVFSNNNVITLNKWQMVTVVYSSSLSTVTFYVNGVNAGTTAVAGNQAPGNNSGLTAYLANRAALDRGFDGPEDDIRIYNRALTSQEVGQLYAATR